MSIAAVDDPYVLRVRREISDLDRSLVELVNKRLQLVAKLISVSSQLGAKRQVFFVSTGRYDTHAGLVTLHPTLLTNLADALRAFYDTTVELGVASQVTTFTGSGSGRSDGIGISSVTWYSRICSRSGINTPRLTTMSSTNATNP